MRNDTFRISCFVMLLVVIAVLMVIISQMPKDVSNKRAIITLPNGEIVQGEVESLKTSEYTYIITIDGITYQVGKQDAVIIKE